MAGNTSPEALDNLSRHGEKGLPAEALQSRPRGLETLGAALPAMTTR
jgi:hypothetical protein